jgi:aminoacrylate hydrolase
MNTNAPPILHVTTADGAVLHVTVTGNGPPLLLVSGLGGTARFWADSSAVFAESFRVIRFDQRGIGASTRGNAACDIDLLARDCLTILDAAGAERAILLGHSTGGCISQSLARQAPGRLAALVLSATWLRPSHYMTALFQTRRAILENDPVAYAATASLLGYPPAWLEVNWSVYEMAVAQAPVSAQSRRTVTERIDALLAFDGSAGVDTLTMPTLVLGTRDDMIVPAFLQEQLAAAIPMAEKIMFDDGGHFFPVSRQSAFTKAVQNWLSSKS